MKDREFVQRVIDKSLETFVNGSDLLGITLPNVLGYDANIIQGTHYIACAGPDSSDMELFIQRVLQNRKFIIRRIIALGSLIGDNDMADFDSYCIDKSDKEYKNYSIQVKQHSGEYYSHILYDDVYKVNSTICSTLSIKAKTPIVSNKNPKIDVVVLPIADGQFFDFEQELTEHGITKKLLWDIFKKTQDDASYTVIHCKAGLGRTGHLILLFEILKNYKLIFNKNNTVIESAAVIHDILKRIRITRDCLVLGPNQYMHAIKSADAIFRYALENEPRSIRKYLLDDNINQSSFFRTKVSPARQHVEDNVPPLRCCAIS